MTKKDPTNGFKELLSDRYRSINVIVSLLVNNKLVLTCKKVSKVFIELINDVEFFFVMFVFLDPSSLPRVSIGLVQCV